MNSRKGDGPVFLAGAGPSEGYIVHVPGVDVNTYEEALREFGDGLLVGCICAGCGSRELQLTSLRRTRGLTLADASYRRISVVLALCRQCKMLERVLPVEALPGKVNGLQALYDAWQGKIRPNAEPGFGLPEVFDLLGQLTGRPVPRDDHEATRVHLLWGTHGPLPKKATERALQSIHQQLGQGRALDIYLDALERRVEIMKRRRRS